MKRQHFPMFVLLFSLGLHYSVAPQDAPAKDVSTKTSPEALAVFFQILKSGDVDHAIAMTAPVKEIPGNDLRAYYQRMSEYLNESGLPIIVAHLQLHDAAVVVFRDGGAPPERIDLDPAYFVKRDDGAWVVSFKLTDFDRPYHDFDEAALADLKKLETWFDAQKPVLQELLRSAN